MKKLLVAVLVALLALPACVGIGAERKVDWEQVRLAIVLADTALTVLEKHGIIKEDTPVETQISLKEQLIQLVMEKMKKGMSEGAAMEEATAEVKEKAEAQEETAVQGDLETAGFNG